MNGNWQTRHRARFGGLPWLALGAVLCAGLAGCATTGDAPTLFAPWGSDSSNELSKSEQGWNCENIENAIFAHATKIAALNKTAEAETKAASPTITGFFKRMTEGPGADSPAAAQIKSERAAADNYNKALRAKGCLPVDIDAKIAAAPRPEKPPEPFTGPAFPKLPSLTGILGNP